MGDFFSSFFGTGRNWKNSSKSVKNSGKNIEMKSEKIWHGIEKQTHFVYSVQFSSSVLKSNQQCQILSKSVCTIRRSIG